VIEKKPYNCQVPFVRYSEIFVFFFFLSRFCLLLNY